MRIPLAAMVRRSRSTRRGEIVIRPVKLPATLGSDLFASSYRPAIEAWSVAVTALVAQYEQSLAAMTRDSPADIGAVLGQVESELAQLLLTVRFRLTRWAERVEAAHRAKWKASVLSAAKVDLGTMLGAGDVRTTLEAAIERNVGLIRSVSEQARTRIGEAVFAGLNQRKPAAQVAKDIRAAVDMSRRRALKIAGDQATKLGAQLQAERRRQAGIDTWEWVSSHKVHFRPEHAARDGKRYTDDDAPNDLPGELPFCGCTERAVLSLDAEDLAA